MSDATQNPTKGGTDDEQAYLDRMSEDFAKVRDAWREKWTLSLALGNGAALLALLNILADPTKRSTETIVPAYFFGIGLLLAAIIRVFQSRRADHETNLYWGLARKTGGRSYKITVDGKSMTDTDYISDAKRRRGFWMKANLYAETASALAFVIGCGAALLIVSLKAGSPSFCL